MTMDEFFAKVEACTEKFEFEQELLQTKAAATPFCKTVKLLKKFQVG